MMYDYSKLLGKLREKHLTQEQLAKAIGMNKSTLNLKLNGRYPFTTKEIDGICKVLDIPNQEIGEYFFCTESLESQTDSV